MRPKPVARTRFGQRRANQRGPDPAPTRPWVHDEFGHGRLTLAGRAEIEITDDCAGVVRGDPQVLGAVMSEFAQYLLADGRHPIEFRCSTDKFAHAPLFVVGQRPAPVGRDH